MEFNEFNQSFHSLRFTSYCEWRYSLGTCDDDDASTFKTLLLIASIINITISLITIVSLYWKLNYRSSSSNIKLWKIWKWSSIDLILFWIIMYCLFRGLHTFITALDLLSNHVILRTSFYEISFIPGVYVILIYLTNIFRLIPKLSFDQTSNRESNIKTIFIPKDKKLSIIFWILCSYTTLSLICSAIIKGYYFIDMRKDLYILATLLDGTNIFIKLFIGFCFIYYGRISVNLTNQSMILAGIDDDDTIKDNNIHISNNCNDSNSISNPTIILNKLHVHKMQIFNVICGISVLFYSFINIFYMIFFRNLVYNFHFEIFYFSLLIYGTPLFTFVLVIAILLPELTTKKNSVFIV